MRTKEEKKICPGCTKEFFRLRASGYCGECVKNGAGQVVFKAPDTFTPMEFVKPANKKPDITDLERDIQDYGWKQVHIDYAIKTPVLFVTVVGYTRDTGELRSVKLTVPKDIEASSVAEKLNVEWTK